MTFFIRHTQWFLSSGVLNFTPQTPCGNRLFRVSKLAEESYTTGRCSRKQSIQIWPLRMARRVAHSPRLKQSGIALAPAGVRHPGPGGACSCTLRRSVRGAAGRVIWQPHPI